MSIEIEDEDNFEVASQNAADSIRGVLRPNPELNRLLNGFIAKMDSRLDEE